jgi:uncharacterized protein (DUF4415 family)
MAANKPSTPRALAADDAPDLSAPRWLAKFEAAPVKRGRPLATERKVSTTNRLAADVEAFRAGGDGWQSRINAALRDAVRKGSR